MVYLHNFVRQAKRIQKMEQEIFLVVKGSLQLLEFYSVLDTVRHQRQKPARLCPASRSPGPTLPVPFTATSLCLASVGARCSISTC